MHYTGSRTKTLAEFGERALKVTSEGYVGMTGQWVQALAVDAFLMGCLDKRSALSSMNKEPQTIDEAVKLMRRLGSHNSAISAEKQSFPLEEGDGASAPLQVEMVENESVDVDQLNESIKTLTKLLAKMPQLLPVQSLRSNQSTKLQFETSMKSLNNIKLNYSLSPLNDMRTIIYDAIGLSHYRGTIVEVT